MKNSIKTKEFIDKANKIHNNLYDYSKVEYLGYHKKVIIIDPEYGEFFQTPANHLKGKGSMKRAKKKLSDKLSMTTEQFIEKARKVHGDLYDYSKVVYINYQTNVIIIDPEYGEFLQSPARHLKGCKCPVNILSMTTEQFIEKARKIHGDLYDYSKVVYVNSQTKIIIIDPEYGEFLQSPNKHLMGQGNKQRGVVKISKKRRLTTEQFIEKARKVHGNLYDYSKVKYVNIDEKVIIIDLDHGEFEQKAEVHLRGSGCPKRITINLVRDHVIPLSIIMSSKERNSNLYKDRPLYKLLNSEINIKYIDFCENIKKCDIITFNNKEVRARNYRNNYNIIEVLLKQLLCNSEIKEIIKKDKEYMENYCYD